MGDPSNVKLSGLIENPRISFGPNNVNFSGLDFSVSRDTDVGSIVVGLPRFVFGLPMIAMFFLA